MNDEVDTSCLLWRDVPAHPCQVCLCGGPGSRSPVAFIWSGLLTLEHHHAAVSRSAEKARSESDRPLRSPASGGTVWREPGPGGRSIHRLSERASARPKTQAHCCNGRTGDPLRAAEQSATV